MTLDKITNKIFDPTYTKSERLAAIEVYQHELIKEDIRFLVAMANSPLSKSGDMSFMGEFKARTKALCADNGIDYSALVIEAKKAGTTWKDVIFK